MTATLYETVVEIGAMPILVRTASDEFFDILRARYGGFVSESSSPVFEFDVDIVPPELTGTGDYDDDLSVRYVNGQWILERGDFHAEMDPVKRRGFIRQTANPYSIDAAFRVMHSILLAEGAGEEGLLIHAASCIRNGRAFLFAGVSGAGKTTISSLAPPDATLLTDEISYVRKTAESYVAFGTPFAGELAKPGENVRAPLGAVYLLVQGPENKQEPVSSAAAIRALMESILFFANDERLVNRVFESACALVDAVPFYRLTFLPDNRVWELIG
jgi:hypothetical protein